MEPSGVVSFVDTSCITTYASTCLPRTLPTDGAYKEPTIPNGQLRLDNLLVSVPDRIAKPIAEDVHSGANSLSIRTRVAGDARDEVQRGCRMAHFGVFTDRLTPFQRGSTAWVQSLNEITLDLSPYTTILDGQDWISGGWGWLADLRKPLNEQEPPWVGVPFRAFASHLFLPGGATAPTICQEQLHHPFGVNSVLGFDNSAFIGNPPRPNSGVMLSPRQQVVFGPGSSAVLTIKDVGTRTLSLKGALEVELSGCSATSCTATLRSFDLYTAPFSIEGTNVSLLRVSSGFSVGVLQGNTLAFPSFSGTADAQLTNGKYDTFPISTGVLLARWDAHADQFVMGFSISGKTAEGDEVGFDGTVIGTFSNTSPTAIISLVSPHGSSTDDTTTIECQSPHGSNVRLSGELSSDIEDLELRYSWFNNDALVGRGSDLTLDALPIGAHDVTLMAYDSRGYAGQANETLKIVDTAGPELTVSDVCFYPPNHRRSLVRLGVEIPVTAVDTCDGDSTATAKIVDVRAPTNDGVVSWDGRSACLVMERDGREPGRKYEVDISVADSHGNESLKTVRVIVPHNGPATNCQRSQALMGCK